MECFPIGLTIYINTLVTAVNKLGKATYTGQFFIPFMYDLYIDLIITFCITYKTFQFH
ncbi:hypothetical protein ACFLZI_03990 [Nitrospirota bacterium]